MVFIARGKIEERESSGEGKARGCYWQEEEQVRG